ncbi:FkbM family methyltransferase, partial [Klebsiella pneumoniae]|nr:FkbM family methyltransferase [Klebsiella pneumoniae]
MTLDDVMAIAPPDVIKIDVEGFGEEVVQGALNTLSKQRVNVVIVEAISRRLVDGNRVTRITNLLESFGFDTYTF